MIPIAFYAPLKPPDHPTPSGDRAMARLLMRALERAGFAPELASRLRMRLGAPDADRFAALEAAGADEADRLIARYGALDPAARPQLWFTYHLYYKAPDAIGPRVAAALGVPYAVAEASRSARRLDGPWAPYASLAEAGIDLADVLFCLTERDRPALEARLGATQTLVRLPPFLDAPTRPAERPPISGPARLLTVAMMREGDKQASYARLAAALSALDARGGGPAWRLDVVGAGEAEEAIMALFAPFGDRVRRLGRREGAALAEAYRAADLFVWPGVGEAFGMVYLEARAAGLPVLAEDRPGVRDVVGAEAFLAPPTEEDPGPLAAALAAALADPGALRARGAAARRSFERDHSLDRAADLLRATLAPLIETPDALLGAATGAATGAAKGSAKGSTAGGVRTACDGRPCSARTRDRER